jgi:hypothetical protein
MQRESQLDVEHTVIGRVLQLDNLSMRLVIGICTAG